MIEWLARFWNRRRPAAVYWGINAILLLALLAFALR